MYALVHPFVQIALLRTRPQDLPGSHLLLALSLGAHFVMGCVIYAFLLSSAEAVAAALVSTTMLVVLVGSLLYINRVITRAIRTMTALAGVDVVIGVAALPVMAWLNTDADAVRASGPASLLQVVLLFWNFAASGHVLRHALGAPFPVGIVVALVFYVLTLSVLVSLFPEMGQR